MLPFDVAQSGESFDYAQDREPVEPFAVCFLVLGILSTTTAIGF
jgi:hypothetical protein